MVKRSRHRPFTAVTRVRFPMESPNRFQRNPNPRDSFFTIYECLRYGACSKVDKVYARLAELADALDLGSSGRPWGFKSLIAHHTETPIVLMGVFVLVAYDGMDLNPRACCRLLINTDDFTTLTIKIILHKRA